MIRHPQRFVAVPVLAAALALAAASPRAARADSTNHVESVTVHHDTDSEDAEASDDGDAPAAEVQVDHLRVEHDASGAQESAEASEEATGEEASAEASTETSSDDEQAAGQSADESETVVDRTVITERQPLPPSAFRNEAVGFKPQAGMVTRSNGRASSDAHGVAGILLDINFLRRVPTREGKPYFGLSVGGLYSHLGNPGSDFLGLNGAGGNRGIHLVMLPANLKAGYTFNDSFRLAAHGGANIQYLNFSAAAATATTTATAARSEWDTNPNLGLDVELGVGRNVGLLLRPDWTFASGDTFFTGTIGLDIPLS